MIVSEISGIAKKEVPQQKQNISTLSDEKVLELAKIGLKIEDHYKSPQDIEWCLLDDQINILQARPVTDVRKSIPELTEKNLEGLKGEWTKSPLDERVSEPLTPFTWSIAKESIPSFFETLSVFGFYFPKDTDLVRLFYGRPYVSKTELEKIFINLPGVVDDFLMGGQTQITRENIKPSFSMATMGFRALLLVNQVHKDWDREYPKIISEFERLKKLDIHDASSKELLENLEFILGLAKSIGTTHALSIIFCEALYQMLFIFVSRYTRGDPNILCPKLVAGLKENKTLETNKKLWILAQKARASELISKEIISGDYNNLKMTLSQSSEGKEFLIQFQDFLKSYGHRSPKYDLYFPSWRDDPNLVLELLATYLAADTSSDPEIMERKGIKERERATDFVLKEIGRKKIDRIFPVKKLIFLKILKLAQKYMMLRENQQFYIGQGYPIGRSFILEIGSRFSESKYIDEPLDIFFLNIEEVRKLVGGDQIKDLKNKINKRKAEFELFKSIDPPAIITREGPKDLGFKESLRGLGGSPGVVTGHVRIITDLDQFSEFKKGEILVAPTTNPSWTPLFMVAKGVVTELGGMLCHGAVVAREYRIPAVLGVKNATRILKNGQKITIDGAKGIISTHD
jgi:pyruvate,water dikinase